MTYQGKHTAESHHAGQQPHEKVYRREYKYVMDAVQESLVRLKAMSLMLPDPHVRQDGAYTIRSLYFDDKNDTCLRENISGTDPRCKFRIRWYNTDISTLRLEKKSKLRGLCHKESCPLTKEECQQLLRGEAPLLTSDASPVKKELLTELRLRHLHPKVIVTYDRFPYVYSGGNVRVTIDKNITSSQELDKFLSADYQQRPVLPVDRSILEVKWDELLPLHIKGALQLDTLQWAAFSKYTMCRKVHL